ncbi:hypothetical protein CDD82_6473 [Ophiocordyceps australis]|uniref:HAD-superfamily subfamily IIA hydrolase n=1 Tax=Ophiocordyceps australis TaxID=1399860 RepID=A0A2C5ZR47_9HYPO|nr:hypothetical protein CDD82_6473 [Ophiocordyceps australis]
MIPAIRSCGSRLRPARLACARASWSIGCKQASLPVVNFTARRHLTFTPRLGNESSSDPESSTESSSAEDQDVRKTLDEIGFAFDIDGVLYQGVNAIPGTPLLLAGLNNKRARYIFLSNGGGTLEEVKAESLGTRMHLSKISRNRLITGRIILSHTPMRAWSEAEKQQTVLITGVRIETAREVANELSILYGFTNVITPSDLLKANHEIYPFDKLKESLHAKHRALPGGMSASVITDPYCSPDSIPPNALRIDKILVWNDPRDWSVDIQLIHDLLVSHRGYLGTISALNGDASLPNRGWQQDGQPELWVSNVDLYWKTMHPMNRFGTGAFVEALKGVWSAVTGGAELQYQAMGKPLRSTFEYAHQRLLLDDAGRITRSKSSMEQAPSPDAGQKRPLRRVYMIGDNPESDIRGASEFKPDDGTEWVPILVRTGVWRQTAAEPEPRFKPAVIVDNVVEAVLWALGNEGIHLTREKLMEWA